MANKIPLIDAQEDFDLINRSKTSDGDRAVGIFKASAPILYYLDAGSRATPDPPLIIKPSGGGNKRWIMVDQGFVYPEWFGNIDGIDDEVQINAALASGYPVKLTANTYKIGASLERPQYGRLIGAGIGLTFIEATSDIDAIDVQGGYGTLEGFTLISSTSFTSTKSGIKTTDPGAPRDYWNNIKIGNDGTHDAFKYGVYYTYGNLCHIGYLFIVGCEDHGWYTLSPDDGADNGLIIERLDTRSNGADGFHITASSYAKNWTGNIWAQSNTGKGVYINSRNHRFIVYGESNSGNDVELGSGGNGNFIQVFLPVGGAWVDGGTDNIIVGPMGTTGTMQFQTLRADTIEVADYTYTGLLYIEHPGNKEFRIRASGSNDDELLTIEHNTPGSYLLDLQLTNGGLYFGDAATDGTWRIVRDGDNLSFQRRESGSYVEKDVITP